MSSTRTQLRQLIRSLLREAEQLSEYPSDEVKVRTFFSAGGGPSREFTTPDELLSLLLTSGARHSRVSLLVPDPDSYSEEPDLFEVGGVSFEVIDGAPPGWEGISWWWPLPPGVDASSKAEVMKSPRYRSMLDAAAVSLQERGGESLRVFGRAAGLPEVGLRVVEAWEDGDPDLLPAGFSRSWWRDLVAGLEPSQGPVEWGGSDTQL